MTALLAINDSLDGANWFLKEMTTDNTDANIILLLLSGIAFISCVYQLIKGLVNAEDERRFEQTKRNVKTIALAVAIFISLIIIVSEAPKLIAGKSKSTHYTLDENGKIIGSEYTDTISNDWMYMK